MVLCTGDSSVKKQGGHNLQYFREVQEHAPLENFWVHEEGSEAISTEFA